MAIHIGTSGWQYADWRGRLYPRRLAQRQWLEHYAARFATVEVNNAFYRLPETTTFDRWRDSTPEDFVFSVKASRYLTHVKRLTSPREPVERLWDRARHLGTKLGPILLQLPGTLRVDRGALEETLVSFPRGVRVAFEPRHDSWFCDEVYDVLARHDAALCVADAAGRRSPVVWTSGWGYLRFHEGRASPHPCYGVRALLTWAERLAEAWEDTAELFVYFNNDQGGCAVRDARHFASAVQRVGLTASRVPGAREASLEITPA